MSIVRSAWIVVVLAIAGCAETAAAPPQLRQGTAPVAPPVTVRGHGLAAELPQGWQAANESLTPHLIDPREALAVATFPLRYRQTGCAHVPSSALDDLDPGDAFVTLHERGLGAADDAQGFPARPAHFGPDLGGPSAASRCVPTAHFADHWLGFSEAAGRST